MVEDAVVLVLGLSIAIVMTLVIVYALLYFFASDPNSSLISIMLTILQPLLAYKILKCQLPRQ